MAKKPIPPIRSTTAPLVTLVCESMEISWPEAWPIPKKGDEIEIADWRLFVTSVTHRVSVSERGTVGGKHSATLAIEVRASVVL